MARKTQQYTPIMWAELQVDCYGGDSCDQHERRWATQAEGDKDGDATREPLRLALEAFPVGTRVVVEVPVCPQCDVDAENCQCGFDWKQWAEDRYA